MKLREITRKVLRYPRTYPRTLGLTALAVATGMLLHGNLPLRVDPAWTPHPINVVPLPSPLYADGPYSGAWPGDIQYADGLWLMGDGRGGLWHSRDGIFWKRASVTENGEPRNMQNAPARAIQRGTNGTYLATFLGGGGLAWPQVQQLLGMTARRRAPIARSTDGRHWDVRPLPESCGIHFSATDGDGTWIAQGCESRLLVSTDDGRHWSALETGLPSPLNAHAHKDGVWVVGAGKGPEGGIYHSRDLVRWRKALDFPEGVTPKRTLTLNGRLVMAGSRRFIASSQNGSDWRVRYLAAGKGATMRAGVWHPTKGYILAGSRGQAMYSQDMETWSCGTIGIGTQITGMAISEAGDVLASGLPALLYRLVPERLARVECKNSL